MNSVRLEANKGDVWTTNYENKVHYIYLTSTVVINDGGLNSKTCYFRVTNEFLVVKSHFSVDEESFLGMMEKEEARKLSPEESDVAWTLMM